MSEKNLSHGQRPCCVVMDIQSLFCLALPCRSATSQSTSAGFDCAAHQCCCPPLPPRPGAGTAISKGRIDGQLEGERASSAWAVIVDKLFEMEEARRKAFASFDRVNIKGGVMK